MRNKITCKIEHLCGKEDAWFVSVSCLELPDAVVMFTALKMKLIDHLILIENTNNRSTQKDRLVITLNSKTNANNDPCFVVTSDWIGALLKMFVNVSINGWSPTAHVDYEITSKDKTVCLCIEVIPM